MLFQEVTAHNKFIDLILNSITDLSLPENTAQIKTRALNFFQGHPSFSLCDSNPFQLFVDKSVSKERNYEFIGISNACKFRRDPLNFSQGLEEYDLSLKCVSKENHLLCKASVEPMNPHVEAISFNHALDQSADKCTEIFSRTTREFDSVLIETVEADCSSGIIRFTPLVLDPNKMDELIGKTIIDLPQSEKVQQAAYAVALLFAGAAVIRLATLFCQAAKRQEQSSLLSRFASQAASSSTLKIHVIGALASLALAQGVHAIYNNFCFTNGVGNYYTAI